MDDSQRRRRGARARGEGGGARLNFIILIAVIGVVGYAAYNYVPVAYSAYLYKDYMQETVNKAAYPPGQTVTWVESQLRDAAGEYDLPPDADVSVQNKNGQIVAHVQWTRSIPMPGFVYEYEFDHTARSSNFINPR